MKQPRSFSSTLGVTFGVVATLALVAGGLGLTVVTHQSKSTDATVAVNGRPHDIAAGPGAVPTAAAAIASPSTTVAPNTTVTAAPAATSHPAPKATTSTAPSGHAPAATTASTAPPTATGAAAGPSAAVAGTYRYRQVGSLPGTPGEGTLVVAPVSATGTQTWTRNVGGTLPAAISVMSFTATGPYLVSPGATVAGAQASCVFATPVPWPPWPMTPGRSGSAHATCTGPITTYVVSDLVQGTAAVSLAGQSITATVVVNTFVLKGTYGGSALNVTLIETDSYVPNLRVPVVTKTHVTGTAIGIPITTDRTDTLESPTPS